MRPLLVLLAACGPRAAGDLNLVATEHPTLRVTRAVADVDAILLQTCDGDTVRVEVGYALNLRIPEPLPVPPDRYCALGVELVDDPFDGALQLEGDDLPGPWSLSVSPRVATTEVPVDYTLDMEGVLALDLALWLDEPTVDAMRATGSPAAIDPSDALATTLADDVGPSLTFFERPEDAAAVHIDLWPDFDFSLRASIRVGGCNGPDRVVPAPIDVPTEIETDADADADADADVDVDVDVDADSDADADPSTPRRRSGCSAGCSDPSAGGGCRGSGCDGGGCSGGGASGCDCDGGAACSTLGFAPTASALLIAFAAARRRSPAPRGSREARHTDTFTNP